MIEHTIQEGIGQWLREMGGRRGLPSNGSISIPNQTNRVCEGRADKPWMPDPVV
jgi:hypothetical protein